MRNKYFMYTAVQSLLEQNKEIWQEHAGFSTTVERCNALFEKLRELMNSLTESTRPTTVRKHDNLDKLTTESIELLGLLQAMALAAEDDELREELDVRLNKLKQGAVINRLQQFQRLAELVDENKAEITELGWSEERHQSYVEAIGSSAAELSSPKLKRDELSAIRDEIKKLSKEKDELLKALDLIVYGFKSTHGHFTNLWEKARNVIDLRSGSSRSNKAIDNQAEDESLDEFPDEGSPPTEPDDDPES
jgi:hypothetical protein